MDNYLALHHASVLIADTQLSLIFYRDVLGMAVEPARPDLGFPGAWLKIGSQQLHLLELPSSDPITGQPPHGGRDRHCAFAIRDLVALRQRLDGAAVPYSLSRSGRRALFCRDPDGNALEFIET